MTVTAPTAPPLATVAPATAAQPAPVLNPNDIAAAIAASSDPIALLNHVVLAVAARAETAAEQGSRLNAVQTTCAAMLRRVRETLLASVGETPGDYRGFHITVRAGARAVDYDRLRDEHPDVYDEVVRVGSPTLVVKYGD